MRTTAQRADNRLVPVRSTVTAKLTLPLTTTYCFSGNATTKRIFCATQPIASYFERDKSFSINLWCYCTTGNGGTVNIAWSTYNPAASYRGHYIAADPAYSGVPTFKLSNNDSTNRLWVRGSTNIRTSTWLMLTVTYDGTSTAAGVKIYVNATLETMTTLADNLSATALGLDTISLFGQNGEASTYWPGRLCVGSAFSRVLSQTEITALYHSGKPIDSRLVAGCLAFWRLGDNDRVYTALEYVNNYHGSTQGMSSSDIVASAP